MKNSFHYLLSLGFLFVTSLLAETALISLKDAEALVKEGKCKEAAIALREVAQKDPENLYALYNYAIAAYANGDFNEASQAFSQVSNCEDKKLRSLALTQMGNAQYRLSQALLKQNKSDGVILAMERSVEYYNAAINEKSLDNTEHNVEVVSQKFETALLKDVELKLKQAEEAPQLLNKSQILGQAVERLDKAATLKPDNQETQTKLKGIKELYSATLANLAREFRKKADEAPPAPKEDKPKKNAVSEAQKDRMLANETYQKALEYDPKNTALKEEHDEYKKQIANAELNDAAATLAQADELKAKTSAGEEAQKQKLLITALGQVEKALGFDEKNERGITMKSEVLEKLEKSYVKQANEDKAKGDEKFAKAPPTSLIDYTQAMKNYQKALDIKPDDAEAKEKLAEVEKSLAKAFVEAAKAEMQKAAEAAKSAPAEAKKSEPSKPGEEASEQAKSDAAGEAKSEESAGGEKAGEKSKQAKKGAKKGATPPPPPGSTAPLQEEIAHMEKAAQDLAQAEALAPGENQAAELQKKVEAELGELRSELDAALAQANAAKGGEAPPGEGSGGEPPPGEGPPGEGKPGGPPDPNKPTKAGGAPATIMLSFDKIRGSTELEGQFVDKTKKEKIRNW